MSEINAANAYDIVCKIDSILNLPNGWEFSYTETGLKRYEESKDKASCTVAVVGNANKGKSYVLQKLAGDQFPSGFAVKTEGLSLKYPKSENLNFILLDTAGLETPLVKEPYYDLDTDLEKEKERLENQQNEDDSENKKDETPKDEYIKEQLIVNYARDKTITEFFLQSFVTSRSDVLILVMNLMTYSDQILLNKVKKRCGKGRKLFVIHNLQNFDKIEHVENYIQNTLMKSLTFKLTKLPMVEFDSNDSKPRNKFFYREEVFQSEDENDEEKLNVIHLIMAYDGENSEAGEYYNESCMNFIRIQVSTVSNIRPFDIKEAVKSYFIKKAPEFIENEINEDNVVEEQRTMMLKDSNGEPLQEIKLKKCSIDELGDESFQDSKFVPPYRTYETEKKDFFVIELELPGDKTIKPECRNVGADYKFYISGMKTNPKELEGNNSNRATYDDILYKRNKGAFFFSISIPMVNLPLKSKKVKKIENKQGIVSIYYELNQEDSDSD